MFLALVDHDRGALEPLTLQMLTFARALDEDLQVAVVGSYADEVADVLFEHGAKKLHLIEHEGLSDYAPQAWAKSLAQLSDSVGPEAIVAPGSDRGNELMGYLGAHMGAPMSANTVKVETGSDWEVTRLRWGSSLWERATLTGAPKLFSVAPHLLEAEPVDTPAMKAVESFTPELTERDLAVRVVRREENAVEGVTLSTAPVVVGGGRGVGSAEGFGVLEQLAELLGAAVGGSRVATNNSWRPHTQQIGLTGNRIAPKLYIACGISGAMQHLVGCKGSKNILVINKDREAPFFAKADYGVVGDLHEVVPAVIEELKKT